jgi:hypothetical protein
VEQIFDGADLLQGFLADEQAAVTLVTEVLQNVGSNVTRFSPNCYAQLLEYLHRRKKSRT